MIEIFAFVLLFSFFSCGVGVLLAGLIKTIDSVEFEELNLAVGLFYIVVWGGLYAVMALMTSFFFDLMMEGGVEAQRMIGLAFCVEAVLIAVLIKYRHDKRTFYGQQWPKVEPVPVTS